MNRLLSLAEMAALVNRSPKTFKSHVSRFNIPHYQLGSSLMFNASEVLQHLTAKATEQEVKSPVIRRTVKKTRGGLLSERLGI